MSFDFTGQNIEDTYQRVLQTDGTNFYDGTGSAVTIGGSQTLQQTLTQGSSTSITITSSADTVISGSGTGSFGHVKATNIEGNSPLNIRGVSKLIFDSTLGDNPSAEFYGNPIFHSDTNVYSSSAFLGTDDDLIFRSNDSTDTLEIGGDRYKTKIEGAGIELVQALTSSIISASGTIIASNLSGTNTGDQDLSPYVQNSQTSSFVQNSQTSSMTVATASFVGTINGGTF